MRAFAPVVLLAVALLAGCASPPADAPPATGLGECPATFPEAAPTRGSGTVTLLTYTAFGFAPADFGAFTDATGYTVEIVTAGDAGEALSKAILTKDAPVADALFGVDDVSIHRARDSGVFVPYTSPEAAHVDDALLSPFCLTGTMVATPLDHGYVMLNHDPAWFTAHGVPLPRTLKDLANATYAPLTVVENPYTSSPGFAFLLATVDTFGEFNAEPMGRPYDYASFWKDFAANGGKVATDWDSAYGKDFTQGYDTTGRRDRPIVVSYSTSPAYNPMNGYGNATSATLDLPGGAWHQVEAIGVLKGAKNEAGARALVDWMLSKDAQEAFAAKQVTYPVRTDAAAPAAYADHAPEPADPASIPAEAVEADRDRWLQGWREAVGQ